jgi:hypothetical protein
MVTSKKSSKDILDQGEIIASIYERALTMPTTRINSYVVNQLALLEAGDFISTVQSSHLSAALQGYLQPGTVAGKKLAAVKNVLANGGSPEDVADKTGYATKTVSQKIAYLQLLEKIFSGTKFDNTFRIESGKDTPTEQPETQILHPRYFVSLQLWNDGETHYLSRILRWDEVGEVSLASAILDKIVESMPSWNVLGDYYCVRSLCRLPEIDPRKIEELAKKTTKE